MDKKIQPNLSTQDGKGELAASKFQKVHELCIQKILHLGTCIHYFVGFVEDKRGNRVKRHFYT